MRAAVYSRYGSPDVLAIRDVPKPQPRPGEVLVQDHATTVGRTDCGMLRAQPFIIRFFSGLRRPKRTILGMDFAGEVEAIGAGVASFAPGDRVFGMSPDACGAHAEYLCVPERGPIAAMPAGARFDEALVCEGAWHADTHLRGLCREPGRRILIYGASGAICTAAVQLAKSYGAEVTAARPRRAGCRGRGRLRSIRESVTPGPWHEAATSGATRQRPGRSIVDARTVRASSEWRECFPNRHLRSSRATGGEP